MLVRWGCSSVVERSLRMWEAPGSIPGISTFFFLVPLYLCCCTVVQYSFLSDCANELNSCIHTFNSMKIYSHYYSFCSFLDNHFQLGQHASIWASVLHWKCQLLWWCPRLTFVMTPEQKKLYTSCEICWCCPGAPRYLCSSNQIMTSTAQHSILLKTGKQWCLG